MVSFFIDVEGTTYQLPVTPGSLEVPLNSKNETHDVIGIGEVSTFGGQELRVFEMECFFPAYNDYSFINTKNGFLPPDDYIELFEKLQTDRKTCRFVVTDKNINCLASVTSFTRIYKYGTEDVHYKLTLQEFREVSVKTLEPVKSFDKENNQVIESPEEVIETPPSRPKEGFAIGDVVSATGNYYYNSLGAKPFGTFNPGFQGKISHIAMQNSFPYHITNMSGGAMGWVTEGQINHVE